MMFNSRGFKDAAADKGAELEKALVEASQGGKLPVVVDTSPCLAQIKDSLSNSALRYDSISAGALPAPHASGDGDAHMLLLLQIQAMPASEARNPSCTAKGSVLV